METFILIVFVIFIFIILNNYWKEKNKSEQIIYDRLNKLEEKIDNIENIKSNSNNKKSKYKNNEE
jgi:F0F1-type ATP synthase membrane subunit b/b'